MRLAEIDHRLDGEEHAGFQRHAFAGAADMDDVRLVVEHAPEAMAAEIAHHAHALRLDKTLDGVADVAGGGAGFHRGNAAHHRLIGHLDQPLGLARDCAQRIHPAGIAVPALDDEGDVDIDDVALLQHPVPRHAVADHVIDRGAGRIAVAAIHQRGGVGAVAEGEFAHEIVDPRGQHPRLDDVGQLIEALRHQRACLAHAGKAGRPVQLDLPGLALGGLGGFDVAHRRIMLGGSERDLRPNLMIGAGSASDRSVSRTRCGILHAAPQSRDRTKRCVRTAPAQQRTASRRATRCAASGARVGAHPGTSTVVPAGSAPPRMRISRTG